MAKQKKYVEQTFVRDRIHGLIILLSFLAVFFYKRNWFNGYEEIISAVVLFNLLFYFIDFLKCFIAIFTGELKFKEYDSLDFRPYAHISTAECVVAILVILIGMYISIAFAVSNFSSFTFLELLLSPILINNVIYSI